MLTGYRKTRLACARTRTELEEDTCGLVLGSPSPRIPSKLDATFRAHFAGHWRGIRELADAVRPVTDRWQRVLPAQSGRSPVPFYGDFLFGRDTSQIDHKQDNRVESDRARRATEL